MTRIEGAQAAPAAHRDRALPVRTLLTAVGRQLTAALVALLGVLAAVFLALDLSGAPVALFISPASDLEEIAQVEARLGYDRPVWERFALFTANALRGQFPDSLQYNTPSMELVLERVPATATLGLTALGIGVAIGLVGGYLAVFSRWRALRAALAALNGLFLAVPPFIVGLALILLFGIALRWLPTGGASEPGALVLPALTLGLVLAIPIAEVFASSLAEVADLDFVRTVRATGRSPRSIRLRHVVPNALAPVITVIGVNLGGLFGGAVIVETLFRWPGIGMLLTIATQNQDYPVILAAVLFSAVTFILATLLVDLLLTLLDPRNRVHA